MTVSAPTQRLSQYWPRRFTLVALSAAAVFICYMDRVNMSVAIIPMAKDLGWDPATQGTVLSAFFVGYLATQILGGRLADRFGGKVVLGIGVLSWSLFTLVTPFAAFGGFTALLFARIGMGVGEGVTFPSIYSLFGRWLPKTESVPLDRRDFFGDPARQRVCVADHAVDRRSTGDGRGRSIPSARSASCGGGSGTSTSPPIRRRTRRSRRTNSPRSTASVAPTETSQPPKLTELLRRGPVWAIIVSHFCNNWGGYVLLAWMPTYITQGLGVDFAAVGLFAVVPSLCAFLFLNVAGWFADGLVKRGWDVTTTRKTMQTIGFGGAATSLMFVGYIHDAPSAIALMSFGSILGACASGGFGVNHLDIAPRYAGVLMGLSNTAATIPGIIGVYVSGLILSATGSWTLVFQVAAGIYLFGMVFYLIFASSKRLYE